MLDYALHFDLGFGLRRLSRFHHAPVRGSSSSTRPFRRQAGVGPRPLDNNYPVAWGPINKRFGFFLQRERSSSYWPFPCVTPGCGMSPPAPAKFFILADDPVLYGLPHKSGQHLLRVLIRRAFCLESDVM